MKTLVTMPAKSEKSYYYKTAAGTLKLIFKNNHLHESFFIQESEIEKNIIDITGQIIEPIYLYGTPFQIQVWRTVMQLQRVTTYKEIAKIIGHPKAHRAVANALAQNKIAYFIPCHKVIREDGNLGGYKWGIERKRLLLNQK